MILEKIINIIEQIKSQNRTTKKISIFETFLKESLCFHEFFLNFYNNNQKLNIGSKVIEKALGFDKYFKYNNVGELAYRMNLKHSTTHKMTYIEFNIHIHEIKDRSGNDLIEYLTKVFHNLEPLHASFFARYISGDLKIGLSQKTINKIFKKHNLPESELFEPMFCKALDENNFDSLSYPIEVNLKYDGLRIVAEKEGNEVKLITRTGEIANDYLPEIVEKLKSIQEDFIIDGEVIGMSFSDIQKRIGRKPENIEYNDNIKYVIFDVLKYSGESLLERTRKSRQAILMLLMIQYQDERLKIAKFANVHNIHELQTFYKSALDNGEEGIVIKELDSKYVYGSRKGWYKVKPFHENTFKVIGLNYGTGQNYNSVGSIVVTDKEGNIKSKVGSGLDDVSREYFNGFMDEYNNKINKPEIYVDIKYQEVSCNKKGEHSLRFPSLLKIRSDKTEADTITIKE